MNDFLIASVKGIPGGGEGKTQFACGVVPEMLGQNVPISGREKVCCLAHQVYSNRLVR